MTKLRFQIWPICAGMALLLTFSTAVQAQTPDGLTPAVETVCDVYEGALFGLCNAYCEAIDCGDPEVRAAERACSRIQANFFKHTRGELIPVDCEIVDVDDECPCFTEQSITDTIITTEGECSEFNDGEPFDGSFKETYFTTTDADWAVNGDSIWGHFCTVADPDAPDGLTTEISEDEANLCQFEIGDAYDTYVAAGGFCSD